MADLAIDFAEIEGLCELSGLLLEDATGVSAHEAPAGKWGAKPHPNSPRSVHECHRSQNVVVTWRKSQPDDVRITPHRCRNWRHAGPCARWRASQDYARMREAFAKHDRAHMVYFVLTLDPSAWDGDGWQGPATSRKAGAVRDRDAISAAYKALVQCWTEFRRQLSRRYTWTDPEGGIHRPDIKYVSTVESHRSGWPHINVVMVCQDIADEVRALADGRDLDVWSRHAKGREVARRLFSLELERSGFGPIAFAELAEPTASDGGDRLAAYLLKLSASDGEAWDGESTRGLVDSIEGRQVAEIAKLSQVPYVAPKGFRRLRSSPKFLPPAHKGDGEWTGGLYRRQTGTPLVRNRAAGIEELARRAQAVGGRARDAVAQHVTAMIDRHVEEKGRDQEGKPWPMPKQERESIRRALAILAGEQIEPEKERRTTIPVITETASLAKTQDSISIWLGDVGPALSGPAARRFRLDRTTSYKKESPPDGGPETPQGEILW